MGTRRNAAMSDHEFIRAARIEQRECELAHDVAWRVSLGLDHKRSVVNIEMEAWEIAEDLSESKLAAYSTSWPNAHVQTFPCCLFQAAVQLTRLVEDSKRDEAIQSTKRLALR
jgi:hypothetical protein